MQRLPRRTFLKSTGATAFAASTTGLAEAGNERETPAASSPSKASAGFRLANSRIELVFDEASGALVSLADKAGKTRIQPPGSAASPLRVRLGKRDGSVVHDLAVCRDVQRRVEMERSSGADRETLVLRFPDLKDANAVTGLEVSCAYTLAPDQNYLRVRTALNNRSRYWVNWLFLGLEAGRRSFSIPPTMPTGMVFGWMDFASPSAGIGTGYLDRGELDMVGHVEASALGLNLGWRLFCLEGSRAFMWGYNGSQQVYALGPGEQFVSDEWLLVLHNGDWRETAQAYRSRYDHVFAEDFLDWQRTAEPVRSCDIVLNSHVAWGDPPKDRGKAYDYPNGKVVNRFADLPALVKEAVARLDIEPQSVILNVLGTGTTWGIYKMPDHLPMCPEAGGQEAADEAFRKIRELGIAGITLYAHPYFLHREATNCVPAADTRMNYPHRDWHTSLGGIACMAVPEWHQLWAEKIYPGFVRSGIAAMYFDEGFGHQFICTKAEHDHGNSALSALSAQSRGATRLYRTWREMAGPNAFLSCEGGSDVQARWIDLWHLPIIDTLRFTHPDKMSMAGVDAGNIRTSVAQAFLMGCPILVAPFPSPYASEKLEGEMLAALRDFVAARRRLRESRSPGYPFGFQDTLGLEIRPDGAQAKVYASGDGVTVVYFTPQAFEGEVRFDGKRLGWPKDRVQPLSLKTKAGEMGFLTRRRS
ncbi:MAG: hypothetical protein ACE15E_20285 [Acidobacteriota bacterium]